MNIKLPYRHQPWVMLWPLALAQMTSWGTLYFSFSLLIAPMQHELGWSNAAINGALTCGLLITGAVSYPIGAALDRYGGRWLMTLGSLGAGVLLIAWSQVQLLLQFYLLWLVLGICLACCLIEPLLAVVNKNFGTDTRKGVTAVMAVVGLSGTFYVPLVGYLLAHLDWRSAMLILAALNLLFNAPVHWIFIPPQQGLIVHSTRDAMRGRVFMRRRLRNPVFWGLVLWYTSYSLTSSSLIFQFVPMLRADKVPDHTIFLAFAMIGPVQVSARLLLAMFARGASITRLGAITSSVVPLAVLVLIIAPHTLLWLIVFAALFGSGHGVTTILRGVAPIEWLGREYFARTMGAIALPMTFALALAPSVTAQIWARTGSSRAMLWGVFAGSLMGTVGYWLAVISRRRARRDSKLRN